MPNTVLITPEGRNTLRGISREYVMQELFPQLGMTVLEKNIEAYDVYTADEAFMTGTPFSILPVFKFNETPVGDGKFGKITKILLNKWSENVGVDIVGQIQNYGKECESLGSNNAPTPYQFSSSDTTD